MKSKNLLFLLFLICLNIHGQTQYKAMTANKFFEISMSNVSKYVKNPKYMRFATLQTPPVLDSEGRSLNWMMDVFDGTKGIIFRSMLWNGTYILQQLPSSGKYSQYPITKDMLDSKKVYQLGYDAGGKNYLSQGSYVIAELMIDKGPNNTWQWWIIFVTKDNKKFYVYIDPKTYEVIGTSK